MSECIFCKIISGEIPCWKVYENDHVIAFFDVNPVSEYHTLVIPKKHYKNVFDTPKEVLAEITGAIKDITQLYQEKLDIHNVQIVNSSGKEAQQDIFHTHFHIVPRKLDDDQNIEWTTHPEWKDRFDDLISQIG